VGVTEFLMATAGAAESSRDEWQRLYREAEADRDAAHQRLAVAEETRDLFRAAMLTAEAGRDAALSRAERAEGERDKRGAVIERLVALLCDTGHEKCIHKFAALASGKRARRLLARARAERDGADRELDAALRALDAALTDRDTARADLAEALAHGRTLAEECVAVRGERDRYREVLERIESADYTTTTRADLSNLARAALDDAGKVGP
jgi:hypothetical protein